MVFQGLDQQQAEDVWRALPHLGGRHPTQDVLGGEMPYRIVSAVGSASVGCRLPAAALSEPGGWRMTRPGAPAGNIFWASDRGQVGQFLHGYRSTWLPVSLLQPEQQQHLVNALFASTRHWRMSLHFNKGLAGAPAEDVAAAQDTAMHPAVLDAFALAISAGYGPPAFPNIPGHAPDLTRGAPQCQCHRPGHG